MSSQGLAVHGTLLAIRRPLECNRENGVTIGRNDPCHCGSGRKYKRCHFASDTAASAAQASETPSPVHNIDERVVDDIFAYLTKRFPSQLRDEIGALQTHPKMSPQLIRPWLAYVADFEGRAGVEWYLEERGWALSRGAREWLDAQQRSWLSVWEVIDFERGRSLTLRDVLTAEERTVHEVSGSKDAERHLFLLARVVDFADVSLICGMHSVPLRPARGAEVVEKLRKALRRRTAVPPDRLRNAKIAWRMLDAWSDAVDRVSQPPELHNTDGDPLVFVKDHWTLRGAHRDQLLACLASIDGAAREEQDGEQDAFVFTRPGNAVHQSWDSTVVGSATVSGVALVAESNSIVRADSLRDAIRQACGEILGAPRRSISDPLNRLEELQRQPPAARDTTELAGDEADTPEANEMVREMKERHYAEWLHQAIPALGGKTPREAAKTKRGREQLDTLLNDLEFTERNQPEPVRFNVRKLRRALGLPV
jgi:hypothetical protein